MSTRELELFCLILDDLPSIKHIFPVVISDASSVGTLKKEIQEQNRPAFDHIAAHTLKIWNVSIPVKGLSDDDLFGLLPKCSSLDPTMRLNGLFQRKLPYRHIHIIIQPPDISLSPPNQQPLFVLNCLVLGHSCNNIFPIEISRTKSVGSLKKAIKEEKTCLFNCVDADDLVIWDVSEVANLNLEKPLEKATFPGKELLSPLDKLSKVFSIMPLQDRLHIVVGLAGSSADLVINNIKDNDNDEWHPQERNDGSNEGIDNDNDEPNVATNATTVPRNRWRTMWRVIHGNDEDRGGINKDMEADIATSASTQAVTRGRPRRMQYDKDTTQGVGVNGTTIGCKRKYNGEEEDEKEDGDEEDVIELDLFGHPDAKIGPGADPDEKCSLAGHARKLKIAYQNKRSRMLPLIEGKFRGETFAVKPGYCAMVCDDLMEPIGRLNPLEIRKQAYVAQVKGIKLTSRWGVVLKVKFWTRIHELKKPQHKFPKQGLEELEKVTAQWELFENIHFDFICLADVIACRPQLPPVIDFNLSQDQDWVEFHEFFVRGRIQYRCSSKGPHDPKVVYYGNQKEGTTYNPSNSCQMLCQNCMEWLDFDELGHIPATRTQKVQGEALKSLAKKLPVIRGEGWLKQHSDIWKEIQSTYDLDDAYAWLLIGTYKLACGEYTYKEHVAAAKYVEGLVRKRGFICPQCKRPL